MEKIEDLKGDIHSLFDDHLSNRSSATAPLQDQNVPTLEVELGTDAKEFIARHAQGFISPEIIAGVLKLLEAAIITAIGALIYALYVLPVNAFTWAYPSVTAGTAITIVTLCHMSGLYSMQAYRQFFPKNLRLVAIWLAVFAMLPFLAFIFKVGDDYSRVWFVLWGAIGLLTTISLRLAVAPFVITWTKGGRLDRRAVIVGGGTRAQNLINALEANGGHDISICGTFDDRLSERSPKQIGKYKKLGTIDELVAFARQTRVDLLIVALPISAEKRVLELLQKLWVLPVDIRLSAHTNKLRFRPRSYSYIGNVPMLDVFDRPLADWDHLVKFVFDKVVAALALAVLSPVMILTALAVRLDSKGPVFFRQTRYGFNNEKILVWKFRSMYVDQCDTHASKLVTRGDPRVTRVGRFIRKTSLDELPQLFNVITGQLSLVGPRPHALKAKAEDRLYEEVVDGYFARHRVKPGITGWAQINGWRGETDTKDKIHRRVEHDLYYIENWNVFLDAYILAMTPFALMKTDNAY